MKKVYGVIYKIHNIKNNKIYIGQTVQEGGFNRRYHTGGGQGIERVYNTHKYNKKVNLSYNKHLLRSIEKYGFDAFEVDEEFDVAYSLEELNKLEYMYINIYNTTNDKYGYNILQGGNNEHPKLSGANNPSSRKVIFFPDMIIFDTLRDGCKYYGGLTEGFISNIAKGKAKYANSKIDNRRLTVRYYEDYLQMTIEDIENIIKIFNNINKKIPVICLNNKEIFNDISIASKKYNTYNCFIKYCCEGKKSSVIFKDELYIFRYLEDYEKMSSEDINYLLDFDNASLYGHAKPFCKPRNSKSNNK